MAFFYLPFFFFSIIGSSVGSDPLLYAPLDVVNIAADILELANDDSELFTNKSLLRLPTENGFQIRDSSPNTLLDSELKSKPRKTYKFYLYHISTHRIGFHTKQYTQPRSHDFLP